MKTSEIWVRLFSNFGLIVMLASLASCVSTAPKIWVDKETKFSSEKTYAITSFQNESSGQQGFRYSQAAKIATESFEMAFLNVSFDIK